MSLTITGAKIVLPIKTMAAINAGTPVRFALNLFQANWRGLLDSSFTPVDATIVGSYSVIIKITRQVNAKKWV